MMRDCETCWLPFVAMPDGSRGCAWCACADTRKLGAKLRRAERAERANGGNVEQEQTEQVAETEAEAKPQTEAPEARLLEPPKTPAFGLSEATLWAVEVMFIARAEDQGPDAARTLMPLSILTPGNEGADLFATVAAVMQRIAPGSHSLTLITVSRRGEARGSVAPIPAGVQ